VRGSRGSLLSADLEPRRNQIDAAVRHTPYVTCLEISDRQLLVGAARRIGDLDEVLGCC